MFGVGDRALSVLNALLSFHPAPMLEEGQGLVVFPSNAQLSVRAHGMAPATLRRHLADLVQAGLVLRRDSPNGKRYARKDAAGGIGQAFGFSLAPLLARADEIEARAEEVRAARQSMRLTREQISMDIQHLWMETRKTALHITHSIPEAVLLADRVVVMGPRPGRIVEVIDIDLPRPRRLDKLPERFHEYSNRIRSIFKSKGVLAMD